MFRNSLMWPKAGASLARIALAAALIAAGEAGAAAQSTSDPHHDSKQPELAQPVMPPGGQSPMGNQRVVLDMMAMMMGTMQRMGMMQSGGMMPMSCMPARSNVDHVEGWLAFLHTELKITDEQEKAWAAFSERARKYAEKLRSLGKMQAMKQDKREGDRFLEVLNGQEETLEARLDHLRAYRKLYEILSKDQKAAVEVLLADHSDMGGPAMMPMGRSSMMPTDGMSMIPMGEQ